MTVKLQIIWMAFDKTRFNCRDTMTHAILVHINKPLVDHILTSIFQDAS